MLRSVYHIRDAKDKDAQIKEINGGILLLQLQAKGSKHFHCTERWESKRMASPKLRVRLFT